MRSRVREHWHELPMQHLYFLQDLAVIMTVAGLVTILFHRFGQPVVLGYILAGILIGPHTLPFPLMQHEPTILTLAELGVVFLMFSLGLDFNFRRLQKVGISAAVAGTFELLAMVWLGYEIGRLFGWSPMDSIFLGAIISISSTTIIAKSLRELGLMKETFAELVFGILIMEDILAILMIVLLSGLALTGKLQAGAVAVTVGKLVVFLVMLVVVGLLAVPRLLRYVGKFKSSEMLLVTVLGLCFCVSLLTVKLEFSVALGAFVIGAIVAEAREIGRIEVLMEPIRDLFSAVFFVTIGLQVDPSLLLDQAVPILFLTAVVLVGKTAAAFLGTFVTGHGARTSFHVGASLAQIGEFSFIIASLGLSLNATSEFLYPIAVSVAALTAFLKPYLMRRADPLLAWCERVAPLTLVYYQQQYTLWISRLRSAESKNPPMRLVRKWLIQISLNLVLVAGVFITAAFLLQEAPRWVPDFPGGQEGLRSAFWLAGVLLTLPLLVAVFRKIQALAILLSELSVPRSMAGARTSGYRTLVAQAVTIVGLLLVGLVMLLLSSALLPPLKVLIVLAMVVGLVTWSLWRSLIRLHSKAQFALMETFRQPAPSRHEASADHPFARLIEQAELETVVIQPAFPSANRLIRELQLRTSTGASIVAIGRADTNIINPGPDEEIMPGDRVLLLGTREQLSKGLRLMHGDGAVKK